MFRRCSRNETAAWETAPQPPERRAAKRRAVFMTRGSTTTFIIEPRGIPLEEYTSILVLIRQKKNSSEVEVIRTGEDLKIQGGYIYCKRLSQEESRMFDADQVAEIQLLIRYDDENVVVSDIVKIDVNRCNYNHTI